MPDETLHVGALGLQGHGHRLNVQLKGGGQLLLVVAAYGVQHQKKPGQRGQGLEQLLGLSRGDQFPGNEEVSVLGNAEGLGVVLEDSALAGLHGLLNGQVGKVLLGADGVELHAVPHLLACIGSGLLGPVLLAGEQQGDIVYFLFAALIYLQHGLALASLGLFQLCRHGTTTFLPSCVPLSIN